MELRVSQWLCGHRVQGMGNLLAMGPMGHQTQTGKVLVKIKESDHRTWGTHTIVVRGDHMGEINVAAGEDSTNVAEGDS